MLAALSALGGDAGVSAGGREVAVASRYTAKTASNDASGGF